MKSPSSSPSESPHQLVSTVSKPAALSDSDGNNIIASEVKNTTTMASTVEEESVVLTNGKKNSSLPQVNGGIAPVRHESGSNKNLTIEIDIPPGK